MKNSEKVLTNHSSKFLVILIVTLATSSTVIQCLKNLNDHISVRRICTFLNRKSCKEVVRRISAFGCTENEIQNASSQCVKTNNVSEMVECLRTKCVKEGGRSLSNKRSEISFCR